MNKIYLTGLSGCGKSSLGRWLADEKKLSFIDLDESIEKEQSLSVMAIFHQYGQEHFRELEHQVLKKIIGSHTTIVALGGGTLASKNNQLLLRDATILLIDRPIAHTLLTLDLSNRPLLQNSPDALYQLHKERHHLYKKLATSYLLNDGDLEQIKEKLLSLDIIKNLDPLDTKDIIE